ncbi:MAG: autoinducer binding domain-containing protein [Caulobacteraceae bacterium]
MTPDPHEALAFAERSRDLHTIEDLNAAAECILSDFGVTCFSANLISTPSRVVRPGILFGHQWQAWSRHYGCRRYHEVDPALRMLRHMAMPFTWSEARDRYRSPEGAQVIRDCLDFTGCGEGLVVPVRERDGALLTAAFSGPRLETDPEARATLHLIGLYYVTRGRDLVNGVGFEPDCPLTQRQLDCLRWAHAGKTDDEIAVILGISRHTAHIHIEHAKQLLGSSKRSVAAFRAWCAGWLD